MNRRRFILSTFVLAACAKDAGVVKESTGTTDSIPPDDTDPLTPITSNDRFYVTTYNSSKVPGKSWVDGWTLAIDGLVDSPRSIDLAGLKALGGEEVEHTLECIGNRSSSAIGNALWRGVRLKTVLESLGVNPEEGATHLRFFCGDGYDTAVPITDLDRGLMLVWEMNGVPLPTDHGAPVRVLNPGRYGMKNPKWIEGISLDDHSEPGSWERVGWSDDCTYQIHSWIHLPAPGAEVPAEGLELRGSAYAGLAPVVKVELSQDLGVTWEEAELTYNPGANVWVIWRYLLRSTGQKQEVWVRATVEDGRVQEEIESGDVDLDGFEGIHMRNYG